MFVAILMAIQIQAQEWKAKWISTMESQSATNTWLIYRKTVDISSKPEKAIAKIAADSKYWLWVNEKLVVFEGGLKRGPTPTDTYYDEVDLTPYLSEGKNTIAIRLWYFGKDGFSHKSSGRAGLIFDCQSPGLNIQSDKSWKAAVARAYQTAGAPLPNFRLPESSIRFDAREDAGFWQGKDYDDKWMSSAMEMGPAGSYPWNALKLRPIPLWKDFGLKPYKEHKEFPFVSTGDTIVCELPYNTQLTPYFKIEATEGQKIVMATDNYLFYGPETNIRAEYITKNGVQEYENPGWINGHRMYYFIPKGIKVLDLKYRETGYNTTFAGNFSSSDPFLNALWEKAKRTLYITMRDTYMDCPERERAQWTGDAVNESGMAFYALSQSSHALSKKWLHELAAWQREDGVMYAPVPAGNWDKELPCQVTASIGYYGLWNYYLHTGDRQTITDLYPAFKRYLNLWEMDGKGTVKFRTGDWTWGDWGDERDMHLIYNLWYYLAVKGMRNTALELGKTDDAASYSKIMDEFKPAFNAQFWNGAAYRDPAYKGKTDDRVQAMAVVAGIADKEKYPAILNLFKTEEHASPYMEKYVFEASFMMGYADEAIARHKKRFGPMVANKYFSTLFEGWGIGTEGFGGGTVNHAWSGGGLTVLSQYLCGIEPLSPAYKICQVLPRPGSVEKASAAIESVAGQISTAFINQKNKFSLDITSPDGVAIVAGIPNQGYSKITLNNTVVWQNGKYLKNKYANSIADETDQHIKFSLQPGKWKFVAVK